MAQQSRGTENHDDLKRSEGDGIGGKEFRSINVVGSMIMRIADTFMRPGAMLNSKLGHLLAKRAQPALRDPNN